MINIYWINELLYSELLEDTSGSRAGAEAGAVFLTQHYILDIPGRFKSHDGLT